MNIKLKQGIIKRFDQATCVLFTIPADQYNQIPKLQKLLESDLYTCKIEKFKQKRSLTANGLLWSLLNELSQAVTVPKGDLYIKMIKRYGVFESMVIKQEAFEQLEYNWNASNTSVEHTESLIDVTNTFESKGVIWVEFNAHYGSSLYDSKQFSKLLDGVISECDLMGINTIPQEEVDRLIKMMEEHEKA